MQHERQITPEPARRPPSHRRAASERTRRGWVALLITFFVAAGVSVSLVALDGTAAPASKPGGDAGDPSATAPADGATEPSPLEHWTTVLERLGDRRARAWESGEPQLLEHAFAWGSPALRRDQAALRAYLRRGLTVEGADTIVDRVAIARRGAKWIELRTVDHLALATATDRRGWEAMLPRDEPSRHLIRLEHTGYGWRIEWVRSR